MPVNTVIDPKITAAPSEAAPVSPQQTGAPNESSEQSRVPKTRLGRIIRTIGCWVDNSARTYSEVEIANMYDVDWFRLVPYLSLYLACFAVIWVGWSPVAVAVAAGLYVFHMFSITGFYHRYFSHRTYRTSRFAQFIFAVCGTSCVQRGPIWWAARHRHHHKHSDEQIDIHSPIRHGMYWSHFGWITSKAAFSFDKKVVPDLMKFPELRFLNRYEILVPVIQAVLIYYLGVWLETLGWATNGWQMLVWGFFISTCVCSQATFTINSLTHMFGKPRYKSKDESKNSLLLALLTFGEGWHNNHHYYPGAVRQGFYWWEIDLTFYVLWCMSKLGIIWDLNAVPSETRERNWVDQPEKTAKQPHSTTATSR